jgi:Pentapeptide repeats (8 copies)/RTX calcium-binding nonapeptide repeat (4 copies)/G8 domain
MSEFSTVIGRSKLTLLLAILFIFGGVFTFTKLVRSSADQNTVIYTELDFSADPGLFASPDNTITATFLESPLSAGEENDTGEVGFDVIPYTFPTALEQTYCWEDDNPEAQHYMALVNSDNEEVLSVVANGECATETLPTGDYFMYIYHDGNIDERIAVFVAPEEGQFILTTTNDETLQNVITLLNTNACAGCDLSGANLSGLDLSGANLEFAILVDANLSGTDLSNAKLINADMSRANLQGANLQGADLTSTILINADLTDANLLQATLENVDMTDAIMKNTNPTGAVLQKADATADNIESELTTVKEEGDEICAGGTLAPGDGTTNLLIASLCNVGAGLYQYRDVNIINDGTLTFLDEGAETNFWAKSILVENGGSLIAGTNTQAGAFGANGGTLTIHLYGSDNDKTGIACKSPQQSSNVPCGIDRDVWSSNSMNTVNPASCKKSKLPDGESDCFYDYMVPDPVSGETGFFGSKVLAVSYGGTLQMYGKKGATFSDLPSSNSGTSWVRLDGSLSPGATSLKVNRDVDWDAGDHVVVSTTDYLPSHSEKLEITSRTSARQFSFKVLDPHTNKEIPGGIQYPHNGNTYPLNKVPERVGLDIKVDGNPAVETRAAVALLTRSIRIISAGDNIGEDFGPPAPGKFFGGHMMARQGVKSLEIQGVEFYQLGQGGRKGRYPAHLHLLRKSPGTYIKDSSIHDSMTRWITLHGTQETNIARNVGYMSIGHGYYLEDGTEINNKLYSNIGILSRAAVDNTQNPRKVPGILAANANLNDGNLLTSYSDYVHPTVFWFTNMWNDIEYNMAAGATACGACYWPINAAISGPSRRQKWESYASIKPNPGRDATAPIKKFKGNYCTTAMNSYNATVSTSPCLGVGIGGAVKMNPIPNPLAPNPPNLTSDGASANEFYYPRFSANPNATRCDGEETDCRNTTVCSGDNVDECMVTVLDRYTTSFNWTQTNFSAIWLRRAFFTVINSAITDVQSAGLTFVTGGDYTQSSLLPGSFMLAANNAFIGNTQDGNPFSSNAGPFSKGGLKCENPEANHCLSINEGISMPLDNFAMNQRLFNIYDGPANQASNAYLNIKKTDITDCTSANNGGCFGSEWMYGRVVGVPKNVMENGTVEDRCILPNAAIAWKQPNGFYYPPAFHSENLFFDNVDIRHFVIEPLFEPGSFVTDDAAVRENYCTYNQSGSFTGWTAIDRQTILNDDDGSLTGVKKTISVNEDPFFTAPIEQFECRSQNTAKTSPYEYVSTVVYPGCGQGCGADWSVNCTSGCYGVPLIRQLLTGPENMETAPDTEIRMMGPAISGRINLTANNANYYIDTTRNEAQSGFPLKNIFKANQTYYTFLIFAKPEIKQTYQFYVGIDNTIDENDPQIVNAVQTNIATLAVKFNDIPGGWPSTWDRQYDSSTGILSVTVDMQEFENNFNLAKKESCRPSSFCEFKSNSCQCSDQLKIDDPDLYAECQRINICRWSGNDPDCPVFDVGGKLTPLCLGFGVTMPNDFVADDMDHRPAPQCFPKDDSWNVAWEKVGPSLAGEECFNLPTPDTMFCVDNGPPAQAVNVIIGTDGDDVIEGTNGPDIIVAGDGDDEIYGKSGDDTIEGGGGNDTIEGNRGDDSLFGGEGDDRILGGQSDDDISGGPGNDFIRGGRGDDDIFGGSGNDELRGGNGNDEINGGPGDDILIGGKGKDTCADPDTGENCQR